ncbi:hypothetical protein Taro_022695 [Colocasia esculenta]|uniref:Ubiquitin-like protease family profile domain-containing protein n=1 Tax=Colocasia esculenta TaxID=4460 RepID=A0A843V203_COLES|nr:hypothetical protein [Colocasia esculenta]
MKDEEEEKRKEAEEAEKRRKEEEEEKKRKEAEAEKKRKDEEEEKRKRRHISPSSLSRRVTAGTRKRRQPEIYTLEDYQYHKATKVNVSTSEPIFVDSQESTDTLPMGKKEGRQDYVAREVLAVDEKSLIERFLNECIINEYVLQYIDLMFGGTLEGYDNFLSFKNIRDLLFVRENESVIIDCYVNTCLFLPYQENPDIFKTFGYLGAALKGYVQSSKDDKSKFQHFDYSFRRLDRAPTEFDLLFSPMHVGTNHWALLVINIKEKEFHIFNSLRNKDRCDIPQYISAKCYIQGLHLLQSMHTYVTYVTVEELRRYMKGKHIDSENWSLRYTDPCPQQGSGDDCAIFTCKYMECLERRDTQGFPFSQDDMPTVRAKFALHFIKAYFNAQERSERI